MNTNNQVFCLIVNYRSADETIGCIRSVRRHEGYGLPMIVVDNFSPDDSVSVLESSGEEFHLILSQENAGYGGGANQGIEYAVSQGAKYVWLLTPDIRLSEPTLTSLVRSMEQDSQLGICGPRILAGNHLITRCLVKEHQGQRPVHEFEMIDDVRPGKQESCLLECDYVDGCCILMRTETLKQVGLFRLDFFLYFEETEFCLRAKDANWKVGILSDVMIKTRSMQEPRNNRDYYMTRNSLIMARVRKKYLLRTIVRQLLGVAYRLMTLQWNREVILHMKGLYRGLFDPLLGKAPTLK
ncbi:glycosyltransferase family 2 protein [Lacunimicrobium album]